METTTLKETFKFEDDIFERDSNPTMTTQSKMQLV